MDFILTLMIRTLAQVMGTFAANWPYLLASALIATSLSLYADPVRVADFLRRHRRAGVAAATAAAVGTPLCSCGTTAVVLGMMAGMMPWAPIVAFLVASPLTSPQELVYSAGLFGWPFALAFFGASVALGLAGGSAAMVLEKRGWLCCQERLAPTCGCGSATNPRPEGGRRARPGVRAFLTALARTGGRLLAMFAGFAFVGYLLNGLIPAEWIKALFGRGRLYSVPLAATLGVPCYVNSEASLPLVRSMLDAGMSPGAALAFLITGAGTSVGAVAGLLTIARWRVVALVVATLWLGAMGAGFLFDLIR